MIWNSINKVKSDCRLVSDEALVSTFEKNGVIVQNYDKSTKSYDNSFYGVDFKRFYISWKTGKIGLTKLDGTGAFQDIINVAKLKNLGYVWEDDIKESTYTQLEYIESTGGQYIDSGFVITNQNFNLLRIEIDAVLDVDGENTQWELNGTAGGSPYCGLGISNTGLLSYGAGDRIRTTSVSIATKKTERHLYVMDYKNKALYIDGEKIANCSITDLTSKSFSKNF